MTSASPSAHTPGNPARPSGYQPQQQYGQQHNGILSITPSNAYNSKQAEYGTYQQFSPNNTGFQQNAYQPRFGPQQSGPAGQMQHGGQHQQHFAPQQSGNNAFFQTGPSVPQGNYGYNQHSSMMGQWGR